METKDNVSRIQNGENNNKNNVNFSENVDAQSDISSTENKVEMLTVELSHARENNGTNQELVNIPLAYEAAQLTVVSNTREPCNREAEEAHSEESKESAGKSADYPDSSQKRHGVDVDASSAISKSGDDIEQNTIPRNVDGVSGNSLEVLVAGGMTIAETAVSKDAIPESTTCVSLNDRETANSRELSDLSLQEAQQRSSTYLLNKSYDDNHNIHAEGTTMKSPQNVTEKQDQQGEEIISELITTFHYPVYYSESEQAVVGAEFVLDDDTAVMAMAGENAQKHREHRNSKRLSSSDEYQQKLGTLDSNIGESSVDDNPFRDSTVVIVKSPIIDDEYADISDTLSTSHSRQKDIVGKTSFDLQNRAHSHEDVSYGIENFVTITEGILRGDVLPLKNLIWTGETNLNRSQSSSVDPLDTDLSRKSSCEQGYASDVDFDSVSSPMFIPRSFSPMPFSEIPRFSGDASEEQSFLKNMSTSNVDHHLSSNLSLNSCVHPKQMDFTPSLANVSNTTETDHSLEQQCSTSSAVSVLPPDDSTSDIRADNTASTKILDNSVPFECLDRSTQVASGARPKERSTSQHIDVINSSSCHTTLVHPYSYHRSSNGDAFLSPSIEDPFDDSFRLDTTGDDTDVFLDDVDDYSFDGGGKCWTGMSLDTPVINRACSNPCMVLTSPLCG
ncbi:hypothetical protein BsWGS_13026 [Bradybaena similaris]